MAASDSKATSVESHSSRSTGKRGIFDDEDYDSSRVATMLKALLNCLVDRCGNERFDLMFLFE